MEPDPDELLARFEREDDLEALDQAVDLYARQGGTPYGRALLMRHGRTGARDDLDQAVAACLTALENPPADARERLTGLIAAADALVAKWDLTAAPADIDAAIVRYRQAADLAPGSAAALSKLGLTVARRRMMGGGEPGDLADALELCRRAVALGRPDGDSDLDRAADLNRLSVVLSVRATEAGEPELARTAIATMDEAIALLPHTGLHRRRYEIGRLTIVGNHYAMLERPEDLDDLLTGWAALADDLPADLPARRFAVLQHGLALYARFGATRLPADRDAAITVLRRALGDPRPGLPALDRFADQVLRNLLWSRISQGARLEDVDELAARVRALLRDRPDDQELREELQATSTARFSVTGDQADLGSGEDLQDEVSRATARVMRAITADPDELEAAIAQADRALTTPGHDEDRLHLLRFTLTGALYARYAARGDRRDLDRSADMLADLTRTDLPVTGHLKVQLALVRCAVHDLTGERAVLDDALGLVAEADALIPSGHDDRRLVEHVRGMTMSRLHRQDGDPAHLKAAVDAYRAALDATPANHPNRSVLESELSIVLQDGAAHSAGAGADAALDLARRAARSAPPGERRFNAQLALGRALAQNSRLAADPGTLDEAISALRRALPELPDGHPNRAFALNVLSQALTARAESTGSPAALDAAIAAGEEALRLPVRGSVRANAMLNLAEAWRIRAQRTGDRADVESAARTLTQALDELPEGHPQRPPCQTQLAIVLSQRYTMLGEVADLDRSVDLARSALAALPSRSPLTGPALQALSGGLWKRADHRGDRGDLDEAAETIERALAAPTADLTQRAPMLYHKAGVLRRRADVRGRPGDLDEAIAAGREALAMLPPGHAFRPVLTKGLSLLYVSRYDDHPGDLEEIVRLGREGLAATSRDDPSWAGQQHVVGHGRLLRFWRTDRMRDLRAAIRHLEASVDATPPDDPLLAARASQLGLALNERYERRRRSRDRDRAMAAFRLSAGVTSQDSLARLENTRMYAGYNLHHGHPVEALEQYRVCVQELLPLAAWRGLDRGSQEYQLRQAAGLATEAAAAALVAGAPRAAVQLLEQGRSVLWAQLLQTRSDRSELRARHPGLAAEFDEVSAVLDRPSAGESLRPDELGLIGRPDRRLEADLRRRATARFTELGDRIRELPGFGSFLRPPDFTALRAAADRGPVVLVNVDRRRCDALLLTSGGLRVLPLPRLSREEAAGRAREFRRTLGAAHGGMAARISAAQTVLATLEWLWDAVTGPVLHELDLPAASDGDPPRLWWCPTGPLAGLPLHAAGRHRDGGPWAGDHVVSSYTPTLQALLRARAMPSAPPSAPVLVAALAATSRPDRQYANLPQVPAEVRAIRAALGPRAVVIEDSAATRRAVLDAIPAYRRVHFACHGDQDDAAPSASRLALHDADLTVLDLTTVGVDGGDLAFLSACETAQGDAALTDEAIHLAAAFQLAGYRNVIGTLWSMYDASAAEVAADVYAVLAAGAADPAVALHRAVTRLRGTARFGSPMFWAPYVHIGV
ncbi:CHAT domain-containing protein [Nonomuraea sp. NPDC005692]|uniref:CHAT domain-containing protein n=1 Tax=Nonomuraea sp. NPDC005692 TaxID=3157168 RepID=UPI00340B6313